MEGCSPQTVLIPGEGSSSFASPALHRPDLYNALTSYYFPYDRVGFLGLVSLGALAAEMTQGRIDAAKRHIIRETAELRVTSDQVADNLGQSLIFCKWYVSHDDIVRGLGAVTPDTVRHFARTYLFSAAGGSVLIPNHLPNGAAPQQQPQPQQKQKPPKLHTPSDIREGG
jgi:hypothetical protein